MSSSRARVLDEVARSIRNSDVIRTLPAGTPIWRARAHPRDRLPTTAAERGSPPIGATTANRMRWTTTRDLRYLDLAQLPPIPSLSDQVARVQRPWLKFLWRFAVEIAQPVRPDAGPVEYVPTQIFTEFIRDELRAPMASR